MHQVTVTTCYFLRMAAFLSKLQLRRRSDASTWPHGQQPGAGEHHTQLSLPIIDVNDACHEGIYWRKKKKNSPPYSARHGRRASYCWNDDKPFIVKEWTLKNIFKGLNFFLFKNEKVPCTNERNSKILYLMNFYQYITYHNHRIYQVCRVFVHV